MALAAKDIYWIAGLLEGEGCFGTQKNGRVPNIQCRMTDRDVIDKLHALLPGNRNVTHSGKPNEKVCYGWYVAGVRAVGIMMTVRSLMGQRRGARIDEVLARWKEFPAVPHMRRTRHRVDVDNEEIRKLHDSGLTFTQVGERLNIGRSTAQARYWR
jgi:hypothetical protein